MNERDVGNIKIDICNTCQGIWFDWQELSKLDEAHEGLIDDLDKILNIKRKCDKTRGQIKCPKCNIPMQTHPYRGIMQVNVDECYGCAGFFLDAGELKIIRDNFKSDKERKEHVINLLKEVPEYQTWLKKK